MKAFFSKIWTWIKSTATKVWKLSVAHKAIAITTAAVVVAGTTCAIVLPISLHEHSYATEWSSDADNHWHDATCKHEEEKSDLAAHTYTNACDTTCDVCGYARTAGAHVYDNACDTKCNICDAERTIEAHVYDNACDAECNTCAYKRTVGAHAYDNACDTACNVCGATRTVEPHVYDNACDTACNVCGATRTITHDHADTLTAGDTTHWYACSVCGDKKDEAAHVFDKEIASSEYLKAEATATTKAQYYKSCVCGAKSATEYFETDKTTGTLANIQDLSKTYDKVELANPTYETNSDGAVTIEWYQGDTKLNAKPVNAGTYKVKVIIAESATYTGISAEKEFTIAKKTLNYLELTKVYDGVGFIAYALGTEHGVVSGDVLVLTCDEEFDYYAGSYYFIDKTDDISLTDAGIDRAFLSGADAGNYQFANQKVSGLDRYEMGGMLTVTKRPVWAENVKFTYDGYDTFCGDEYPVFTLQNVVSGETIDLGDVSWCFDSKNVGATLTAVELSEEYNPNYTIDFSKCSASIIPRVIDNLTYAFEYNGMEYRQAFISKNEHSDIVGADEITLEVCFATSNVGAALDTSDETGFEPEVLEENYVLGENYSFSIVPKKLTLKAGEKIEMTETYNGLKQHTLSVSSNRFDGYVDTEAAQLWLTATLPSKNAGEYTDDVILTPYVGNSAFGTVSHNYDFSEVAATVKVNKMFVSVSGVTAEYNGTTQFTFAEPLRLTSAHTGGGQGSILSRDEVYLNSFTLSSPDVSSEELLYEGDYVLSGADVGNYEIDEFAVEITKKKLTNLEINVTEAVYNVPGTDGSETATITLLVKDGVVPGETVKITVTNYAELDLWSGTFELCLKSYETLAQGQEIIALVASGDYANYELVADANGVVGLLNIVTYCEVQYDGSCNCGTSHLTETLTFTGGEDVGKSATIACDFTYEGGIYKIALDGGQYEFSGSDQFFNISGIYDVNGYKLADSIGTYILPKGTYYFHVYVGTSPYSDTIWVKKTAKMLDAATMANAIVPDMEPGNNDVGVRIHNLQTHNGGDTFVLFYSTGENANALGQSINFRYEDGDGGYSATSNIESIEFYDVNGIQLNVTYDEPDMLAASGVTAVGGVYIVVTMNGEGMDNLYFYAV